MKKVKVIQGRLKITQSHQKSYTNVRRRNLEFEVKDWVYLKVAPTKGVIYEIWEEKKFIPRYISPYQIIKRIGDVPYELELTLELAAIYPIFHILMLKKCFGDPSLVVSAKSVGVKDNLSNKEIRIQILDYQIRRLRTKEIASLKVFWRN